MKKFLALGALALAVAAFPQQKASAWINNNFSIGLNWTSQRGGNNLLWGVFRNGQPGGCDLPNCPAHYYAVQHGYDYQANGQGFGHGYDDGPFMPGMPAMNMPAPMTVPAPAQAPTAYWYGQPAYQTVNYAPTFPSYYSPVSWYGR
jgi:hypothetical protein